MAEEFDEIWRIIGYVLITAGIIITALGGILFAKFKPWLEERK